MLKNEMICKINDLFTDSQRDTYVTMSFFDHYQRKRKAIQIIYTRETFVPKSVAILRNK